MRILPLVLLCGLWYSPAQGQRPPALDTAALSACVASTARAGQLPDVAVVVVGPEGPVYEAHFGAREPGPAPGVAASDVQDPFYLGALSETLTAFAVMRLVDDEVVDLDATVVRYLPDLAFRDPDRTSRLTIRHLLAHRSGLPRIGFFNRRVRIQGRLDHIDFVRDPGAAFEASSLDYLVLGRVLEAASGQPYATHMSERVFGPLGIESVAADGETARLEGAVRGHRYLFGWPVATAGPSYGDPMVPATYLAAGASEAGRFLSLLLSRGRRNDTRLLSVSGVEALLPTATPSSAPTESPAHTHTPDGTTPEDLGPRWSAIRRGDSEAWFQEGLSPGFHAFIAVLPARDLGVVVLTNRAGGPGPDAPSQLLRGVVDRVLGRPGQPYFPWERILHVALLVFVVGWTFRSFRWYRHWVELGRPQTTAHTRPVVGRLALDLAVAATLPLVVVLGLEKISIMGLLELHPDLGIAVIVFPIAAIPMAVWRTLVNSEEWRRGREAAPPPR